jgi:23S rRNA pseudouridine955/2504/2580 synthase
VNKPAGLLTIPAPGGKTSLSDILNGEPWRSDGEAHFYPCHRLDRETSGVLLVGKKRSALTKLHEMMRENRMRKRYLLLVKGVWHEEKRRVVLPLKKYNLETGEKRVSVEEGGQHSETVFRLKQQLGEFTLLEAELVTGRTHQLRVQLAHLGFPIAGDDKYGDFALNKALQKRGLKRMFLHSAETVLHHPLTGMPLKLIAPLPQELAKFLETLKESHAPKI